MDEQLYTGEIKYSREKLEQVVSSNTSGKKEKGGTYQDTLDLHRKGISLKEIAEVRGLALSTIKGHMAKWILTGDVNVSELLPAEAIQEVSRFLKQNPEKTVSAALNVFGDKYDGGDLRMIVNQVLRESGATTEAQ
jgi:uncharacterized protein YpbB